MRAVVQREYGGPGCLQVAEVPAPVPANDEVLVRVHAAAVDRGTWHLMTGLPLVGRLALGLRRPKDPVVGRDVAGVVEAVGPGVTDVAVGDQVVGTARGSIAELAVLPLTRLARKPAALTFEQAAALPISGVTALQAVRAATIVAGDRVLVLGASGGVGTYVAQLAVAAGAEVTAVCSAAKADVVRGLGATTVLDHRTDEATIRQGTHDVVVDIGGNRPLAVLRRMMTPTGRLVVVGGEGGGRWFGGVGRSLRAALLSPFVRQRLSMLMASEGGADLVELVGLAERGVVRPVVDRSYPLADAADALRRLASGDVRGKVTVAVVAVPAAHG